MQRRGRRNGVTPAKIMAALGVVFVVILMIQLLRVVAVEPQGVEVPGEVEEPQEERLAPVVARKLHYGIMGDLGSSGSRVYVYKWRRNDDVPASRRCTIGDGGELLELDLIDNWESYVGERERNEKKPGISSLLKKNPSHTVEELIGPLLDYAKQFVPAEQQAETPIFFFATAGLRTAAEDANEKLFDDDDGDGDFMLEEDDDAYGEGIIRPMLQQLREFVRSNSDFVLHDNHVKVLDGSEEATYDWLSLQMFLRNGYRTMLKNDTRPINPGALQDGAYHMGLIDCGGASVQIAYRPEDPREGSAPLRMFSDGSELRVAAHSFLTYGMYAARARHEETLAQAVHDAGLSVVHNPCILRNNTQHVRYNGVTYDMPGGGDYEECYRTVWRIFNWGGCTPGPSCTLEGRRLEKWPAEMKFLAIDNAYRTGKFYQCGGYCTIRELKARVMDFCYTEWSRAVRDYGKYASEFRIRRYCFEGTYLVIMLEHGFRLPVDVPMVAFSDYVGGTHINWALGAMAHQATELCETGR